MSPRLTVVIPTQGRATLGRALDAIRSQAGADVVEVLVVADTHSPLLMDVRSLAESHGCRYLELDAACHAYGYPQIQLGYDMAEGRYIASIGDDDVYRPGALGLVLDAIRSQPEPVPLLFRSVMHPSPSRPCGMPQLLGSRGLERGAVSTQNLVAPNDPDRLGFWWDDFAFIAATINRHGGRAIWREEVVVDCY